MYIHIYIYLVERFERFWKILCPEEYGEMHDVTMLIRLSCLLDVLNPCED
jgi:hypothetical protein